jgi:hypothetical protein
MAIVIDVKNAIRKAIYSKDSAINFFFNEILKVQYPYVFFYIPSYRIDRAIDVEYWRKLTLMCVVEYAKEEDSTTTELWEYSDILTEAYKSFDFLDTKLSARNIEFKTVEGVLQMTFDLECYVKATDDTELMKELDLTLKAI